MSTDETLKIRSFCHAAAGLHVFAEDEESIILCSSEFQLLIPISDVMEILKTYHFYTINNNDIITLCI